ncbi:hypothetical protein [Aquihabitans sp. McL0605]|uniref:hypothetical protein n=1 Tax=Aquihabitans sp. McL0605 TaxID=3415671 RepID=UPI003CF50A4E
MPETDADRSPESARYYQAKSQTKAPKLVVFLIDESRSMLEPSGGVPKKDLVDKHVNQTLRLLGTLCSKDDGSLADRMYAAALGYGGKDKAHPEIVSLFDRTSDQFDQADPVLSISQIFDLEARPEDLVDGTRQFIQSRADGWTPMGAAVKRTGTVIHNFVAQQLATTKDGREDRRFPLPAPVILNVTDGRPTDDDLTPTPVEHWAQRLSTGDCYPTSPEGGPVRLIDGPPLLINIGTPEGDDPRLDALLFPTEAELPPAGESMEGDGVRRLWRLASPMHPNLVATAVQKGLLPQGSTHHGRRLYASTRAAGAGEGGPGSAGQPGPGGAGNWSILERIFEWGSVNKDQPH